MRKRTFAAENRGMVIAGTSLVILALLLAIWAIPWGGKGKAPSGAAAEKAPAIGATGDGSDGTGPENGMASSEEGTQGGAPGEVGSVNGAGEASGEVGAAATGEDFSYTSPTRRYVNETQRHQNFLAAVAAGLVRRMDFISTDYQPSSDPNSSYIAFSLLTADGSRSTGLMVMKQESGMWRLSAVKQLSGSLAGGTNYLVPAGFEEVLAAELREHQPFFSKLAQGRVSSLIVDEDRHPSDTETVLIGRVVGRSGRVENTVMYLRKDYNLWHITGFDYR